MRSIFSLRAASAAVGLFGLVVMGLAQTIPTPTWTADGTSLDGHATGPVLDLRVSPNGQLAASVVAVPANPGGAELRVRNALTGAFLWSANLGPLPEAGLPRVAFTNDSGRLVFVQTSAGGVESVIQANPTTGATISSFTDGDSDFFRSRVVISPNGLQYAYQSGDNRTGVTRRRIVIRQVSNNANVQQIIIGGSGSSSDIRDFNFTPAGTELVIALASGNVYRKLQVAPETEVDLGFAGSTVNRIERIPGSTADLMFAQTTGLQRRAVSNGAVVRTFSNIPAGGVTGIAFMGNNPSNGEPFTVGAVGAFNFATLVRLDNGNLVDSYDLRRTGEAATDSRMNGIGWTGSTDRAFVFGSNGAASPATRVLRVAPAYQISVSPTSVIGGNPSVGTLTLPGNAPTGGLAVALTSTEGTTVPATVTVPAGSSTANFDVLTPNVDIDRVATISANFPFGAVSTTLGLERVKIVSLEFARETVGNTQSTTGTVTLNIAPTANRVVSLSLDNANAGTIPATVTVLGGSNTATFTFTPKVTETNQIGTVTASLNSTTASDSVTVLGTTLRGVELYPNNLRYGQKVKGVVRLVNPANEDTTVTINSNRTALFANQSVVIPAGSSYGVFNVTLGTQASRFALVLTSSTTSTAGNSETRTNTQYANPPSNLAIAGAGMDWQLGDRFKYDQNASTRPAVVASVKAASTEKTILAVTGTGEVRTAGTGIQGELGYGGSGAGAILTAFNRVSGLTGIVDIATGKNHVVAMNAAGQVWAWGRNAENQLGDGTAVQRNTPVSLGSLDAIALAAGDTHTLILTNSGTVLAFGTGANGQLGLGATTNATTPTLVSFPGSGQIVAIAAGHNHSAALHADGTVYVWGRNVEGQLGLGDFVNRDAPTAVPGLSNVRDIALGGAHTVALVRPHGGTTSLFSFGAGGKGQLGLPTVPATRNTPTLVNLLDIVDVEAGSEHSVAVSSSGIVYVTGENANGQLALGTFNRRSSFASSNTLRVSGFAFASRNNTLTLSLNPLAQKSNLLMVTAGGALRSVTLTGVATAITGTYPTSLTPIGGGFGNTIDNVFFLDNATRKLWTARTANFVLEAPLESQVTLGANDVPAFVADMDVNGRDDVISVDSTTREVKAWLWNGVSLLSSPVLYTLAVDESLVGVADMDGDRRTDLLIRNNTTNVIRVRRHAGATFLSEVSLINSAGAPVAGHAANLTPLGPAMQQTAGTQELIFINTTTNRFELWDLSRTRVWTIGGVLGPVPAGLTPLGFWR